MTRLCAGLAVLLWAIGAAAELVPQALPGVDARTAALLLSGQRGGSIRAAVSAGPVTPAEGAACRLDAWIEVDGDSLLGDPRSGSAEVEVSIYAMAAAGRVTAFEGVLLHLDQESLGERLRRHGLRLHRHLAVPCGVQTLRVLVLNVATDEFFLGEAEASLAGEGWIVQVLAPPGEWVEAVSGDLATSPPAARPLLRPGSVVWLALYPPGDGLQAIEARGRLAGGAPEAIATPMSEAASSGAPGEGRTMEWLVPDNAAEGSAELQVLIAAAGGDVVLRVPVSVGRADGPLTWLEAEAQAAPAAPPASSAERLPSATELRAEYLGVLQLLTGEDVPLALQTAAELQRRVIGDGNAARRERLARTVLGVAAEVAGDGGRHLSPLLWLHLELFHHFAGAFDHLHATAAADHVVSLTGLCDRGRCSEQVRAAAGWALASLGGAHARRASWQPARRHFRRALALAPELDEARLGAAAVAEWIGEYREAVDVMRSQENSPGAGGEALLRLGVNLRRLGEERRARAVLQRCASADAPQWARVVALEELARMELAAGRPGEAVALLAPAVGSLPGEPSLRLLLAHALEGSGDMAAAAMLLRELAAAPGGLEESPRLRYTRWSEESAGAMRRAVRDAARPVLPALAAVLAERRESS